MRTTRLRNTMSSVCSFVITLSLISLSACSTIAPYSEIAYQQATSLKVDSLVLMDNATEAFTNHESAVKDLKTKLEKALEYAKGRPKNDLSARQWKILIDPNRDLLGGFLKRWENEETLNSMFVTEAKGLVSDAFDTIIGLESGKIKADEIQ